MRTRAHIHKPIHMGDRIADAVVGCMGSWSFIIIQSIVVLGWIVYNVWALTHPFDAYPFILLNLLFSTQAAYASPLILMSQNRQSKKDKARDDIEAREVQELFDNHDLLLQLNRQQLEILKLLQGQQAPDDHVVNRILMDLSNVIGKCKTVEEAQRRVWEIASREEAEGA